VKFEYASNWAFEYGTRQLKTFQEKRFECKNSLAAR